MTRKTLNALHGLGSYAQSFLRGASILFVSNIAVQGLAFVGSVIVVRGLGPEDFGIFSVALVSVQALVLLLNKGLEPYGTRVAARSERRLARVLWGVLWIRLAIALVIMAVAYAVLLSGVLPISGRLKAALFPMLLLLPGMALFLLWALHGRSRFADMGLTNIIQRATYVGVVVLFFTWNQSILIAVCATLAGMFTAAGFTLWRLRKALLPRARVSWRYLRTLFCVSAPLGLSSILVFAYNSFDVILVASFTSEAEAGYFRAALSLVPVAVLLPGAVTDAYLPRLMKTDGAVGSVEEYKRYLTIIVILACLLSLPFALFPHLITNLLFGDAFAPTAVILQISALRIFFICTSYGLGMTLIGWRMGKTHLRLVVVGFALSLALNLVLIPVLGGSGAAIAGAIAEGCMTALFGYTVYRTLRTKQQTIEED